MAMLALNTSAYRNAVSRLHRQVSQEMWHDLWPNLPVWEVPITSVTNGVHLPSWLNGDLAALYDQYLEPDWRERFNDPRIWDQVQRYSATKSCWVHRRRKRRLMTFVRERAAPSAVAPQGSAAEVRRAAEVLDPERADHRFRAPLRHLQTRHAAVPRRGAAEADSLQPEHAGADRDRRQGASARTSRARPSSAKSCSFRAIRELWKHIVFVEDYDMKVARETGAGRGPLAEHSAARRGSLRHQRHEGGHQRRAESQHSGRLVRRSLRNFRRLGHRRPRALLRRSGRDARQRASTICWKTKSCRCFTSSAEQAPARVDAAREAIPDAYLSPQFDSRRMVREYVTQFYDPAHTPIPARACAKISSGPR